MQLDTSLGGLNDLLINLKGIREVAPLAVGSGIAQVSKEVAEQAQANHTFQNQTGNLEASIQALPVEIQDGEIVGQVKAGMEYAHYVEFGTSKMPARPFLTTAVEANQDNLKNTIASALERANKVIKVNT